MKTALFVAFVIIAAVAIPLAMAAAKRLKERRHSQDSIMYELSRQERTVGYDRHRSRNY